MKNADMPAMPIIDEDQRFPLDMDRYGTGSMHKEFATGLTKREMMAMHMMASIQASGGLYDRFESMAKDAATMADALLAELERTCQKP